MQKKISIVIPTYNRSKYLEITLKLFYDQIKRHSDCVELIICDNGSTDDTNVMVNEKRNTESFCSYVLYEEHVPIGLSIQRSILNATGTYVLLWGDDDLPLPYTLDYLLDVIKKNSDVGLVHFNRLVGYDYNIKCLTKLTVHQRLFCVNDSHYENICDFMPKHYLDASFLSSIMFLRESWLKSSKIDSATHYGYEFLAPIFYGVRNKNLLYICAPLIIQRMPIDRSWISMSPYFRFIGIPNMLKDYERWGLVKDAEKLWMMGANNRRSFLQCIAQVSLDKKFYRSIVKEINSNQYSFIRKIIVYFFVYLFPAWLYKYLRRIYFSKKI